MNDNLLDKVSVNVNTSTLSSIDLLIDNGYYSNRSDFINQALRESLQKHQKTLDRIIEKNEKSNAKGDDQWFLGVYGLERLDLEEAKQQGKRMEIKGYGVLVIGKDIDEELLFQVVSSIKVKGKVLCTNCIREHYGLK